MVILGIIDALGAFVTIYEHIYRVYNQRNK